MLQILQQNFGRKRDEVMGVRIISFTEKGMELSNEIKRRWDSEQIELFTKCSAIKNRKEVRFVEQRIGEWAKEQMKEKHTLLFIGACGIAVRAIAPYVTDKLCDSPVLVMDERGAYIIPILSGHIGGANEIAMQIAFSMDAIPVITTATDINGKFAVDLFAKRNGLYIVNKDGIGKVSAKALLGKEIIVSIEQGHLDKKAKKPKEIHIVSYPPKQLVDLVITAEKRNFDALINLKPKEYVIGMGCKRGKEAEKIEGLILKTIKEIGISKDQIFALASIDRKKKEEGLAVWSRKAGIPFFTFTAKQLQEVEGHFLGSEFVKQQVGVDNVCERAALKACGKFGTLIYKKYAEDGMTIAIAKRKWSIVFDEK